jgi:hypothetical protein
MSFQAYLDNIKEKTGKSPADFAKLAAARGLTAHSEIIAWLKTEFELGHGHANAIATFLKRGGSPEAAHAAPSAMDTLFSGTKAIWRTPTDALLAKLATFGPDSTARANETYVNLLRGTKKFGIVQPGSATRLDIGIKRKGVDTEGRFEASGQWNAMVTHRVKISDKKQLDAELLRWLRAAYDAV